MKTCFILIFGYLIFPILLFSQDKKPTQIEKNGDQMLRFYYDNSYFLVDKNCEFKSIERVSGYNIQNSQFEGDFTDFLNNGNILLQGKYLNGKKEGLFTAYHFNGKIKWEVTFKNDYAIGDWKYYYPDGNPLMVIQYDQNIPKIMSFWDQKGKALIINGNGTYDFRNPYQEFNPYGYPFVKMKGKIKNGLPTGFWQVYFENDQNSILASEETYRNGVFLEGYDLFLEEEYSSLRYLIGPIDNFTRAEWNLSKSCSFDEHTGFTNYLASYFTSEFEDLKFPSFNEKEFVYHVKINKDGKPLQTDINDSFGKEFDKRFLQIIKSLDGYIPSFRDGFYIDDTLTIKGKVLNDENDNLVFHSINIIRKKERQ